MLRPAVHVCSRLTGIQLTSRVCPVLHSRLFADSIYRPEYSECSIRSKELRASEACRPRTVPSSRCVVTCQLQCTCRRSMERYQCAYLSMHHFAQCSIPCVQIKKCYRYRSNTSSSSALTLTSTLKGYIDKMWLQYRRPCRVSIPRCGVFVAAVSWFNQKACRRPLAGRNK